MISGLPTSIILEQVFFFHKYNITYEEKNVIQSHNLSIKCFLLIFYQFLFNFIPVHAHIEFLCHFTITTNSQISIILHSYALNL
jgi:hypothetical protein